MNEDTFQLLVRQGLTFAELKQAFDRYFFDTLSCTMGGDDFEGEYPDLMDYIDVVALLARAEEKAS